MNMPMPYPPEELPRVNVTMKAAKSWRAALFLAETSEEEIKYSHVKECFRELDWSVVEEIETMECLQRLDPDIFWPIVKAKTFGTLRKFAAIDKAAGTEAHFLRRMCEDCSNHNSPIGVLTGMKLRLINTDLRLEGWQRKFCEIYDDGKIDTELVKIIGAHRLLHHYIMYGKMPKGLRS